MIRFGCRHRLLRCCSQNIHLPRDVGSEKGPSYYIIPEIPHENHLTSNVFQHDKLPKIDEITPEIAFNGLSRLLINQQLALSKLSDNLRQGIVQEKDVLTSLEEILYPVEHAFQSIRSICTFDKEPMWSIIIGRLYQKTRNTLKEHLCLDSRIYRALLTKKQNETFDNSYEKGFLEVLTHECWEQGASLFLSSSTTKDDPSLTALSPSDLPTSPSEGQKQFNYLGDTQAKLTLDQEVFQNMVMAASSIAAPKLTHSRLTGRVPKPAELVLLTGTAQIPIAESDLAPSAPPWLIAALRGERDQNSEQWPTDMRLNLASDITVRSVLQHCSTRQLRESVWHAWVQRASMNVVMNASSGRQDSNNTRIQNIRHSRRSLANLLGCRDYLSFLWRSSHAQSPSSPETLVDEVLEPIRKELNPIGQTEFKILSEWASSNLDLSGTKLEAWDIDFAIEQYNYAATGHRMQSHVAPAHTGSMMDQICSLLDQLSSLFGLRLIRTGQTLDSSYTSSAELTVCSVEDASDGSLIGELILDLFDKPGRSNLFGQTVPVPIATRTGLARRNPAFQVGSHSVVMLVSSLPPNAEREGIHIQELLSITFGFGSALQHILPKAHFHQLSGPIACLSPDARNLAGDLCSALMLNTILPSTTQTQQQHLKKQVDEIRRDRTYAASRSVPGRISALPLLRQLYESRFDLSLWSHQDRNRHWTLLNDQHWASHMPFARNAADFWPCSAVHLFGPNSQPGRQYQHVWRQLLLSDVVASLQEVGWPKQSDELVAILKQFRDSWLSVKDCLPPAELFQQFQGRREPLPSFLIRSTTQTTISMADPNAAMPIFSTLPLQNPQAV